MNCLINVRPGLVLDNPGLAKAKAEAFNQMLNLHLPWFITKANEAAIKRFPSIKIRTSHCQCSLFVYISSSLRSCFSSYVSSILYICGLSALDIKQKLCIPRLGQQWGPGHSSVIPIWACDQLYLTSCSVSTYQTTLSAPIDVTII